MSCAVMPKLINLEHVRKGAGPRPCTVQGGGKGSWSFGWGGGSGGLAGVLYIGRWDQGPLQMWMGWGLRREHCGQNDRHTRLKTFCNFVGGW